MAADALIHLREVLAEKFPQATAAPMERPEETISSGLAALDEALGGGFSKRTITEITGGLGSAALLMNRFLNHAAAQGMNVALVDSVFAFDPATVSPAVRSHLLWVACRNCLQAMKAADMLLRDGNLPLVLLDLQLAPVKELRRIPAGNWHRLQRLVEENGSPALVLTPAPMVAGRRTWILLHDRWGLETLRRRRETLEVRFEISRKTRALPEPAPIRRIA